MKTAATAGAPIAPGRPAQPDGRYVVDVLFVDLGDAREDWKTGLIRWTRQPRARFECLRCRYASPTVTGPDKVRSFVTNIRTDHRSVCTAPQEHRQ